MILHKQVKNNDQSIQCTITPSNMRQIKFYQKRLKDKDVQIKNLKNLLRYIEKHFPVSGEFISTMFKTNFGRYTLNLLLHQS